MVHVYGTTREPYCKNAIVSILQYRHRWHQYSSTPWYMVPMVPCYTGIAIACYSIYFNTCIAIAAIAISQNQSNRRKGHPIDIAIFIIAAIEYNTGYRQHAPGSMLLPLKWPCHQNFPTQRQVTAVRYRYPVWPYGIILQYYLFIVPRVYLARYENRIFIHP